MIFPTELLSYWYVGRRMGAVSVKLRPFTVTGMWRTQCTTEGVKERAAAPVWIQAPGVLPHCEPGGEIRNINYHFI